MQAALTARLKQPPTFAVVFLDPPYEAAAEYAAVLGLLAQHREALLAADALVVAEHARRDSLLQRYGCLERTRVLLQGDAALSFFAVGGRPEAGDPG